MGERIQPERVRSQHHRPTVDLSIRYRLAIAPIRCGDRADVAFACSSSPLVSALGPSVVVVVLFQTARLAQSFVP